MPWICLPCAQGSRSLETCLGSFADQVALKLRHSDLRRTVQLQLSKGEYRRNKLPRWIFFANQGELTSGDSEEILNKASALSLVSNAILYCNTARISNVVDGLSKQGETVDDDTLAHISLLPYKHVLSNGTCFLEGEEEEDE